MNCYTSLAGGYDSLTEDVQYEKRAAFLQKLLAKSTIPVHTVLDLACGTGTMTCLLAEAGYEMIGVDASPEMLMQAMNNTLDCEIRPVFLHQRMEELDLYGTIQAVLCCLDSVNYVVDPSVLREAFRRVSLFLEPDGVFVFDVNTKRKFDRMNGQCYVRDDEDVYCAWQVDFDGALCTYDFDIFERIGEKNRWERMEESHLERYYAPEELCALLEESGFDRIELHPELSFGELDGSEDRIFIIARKRKA